MEEPHPKPKGTIAVLVIFALLIVVLLGLGHAPLR
jgi:hypothetical protein